MQEVRRGNLRMLLAGSGLALLGGFCSPAFGQEMELSPLPTFAQYMSSKGVTFHINYLGAFADNPSGGATQSGAFAYQLSGGADFDLGKLVGIQGGTIHVNLSERSGYNLGNTINDSISPVPTYGGGQTYHLNILTYEQKLFDGVLVLTGGRSSLGDDAAVDPIYTDFQTNAIHSTPKILVYDTNETSSQVPVWMGHAVISPTKNTYIFAGIYDANPTEALAAHHGIDFSIDKSVGAQGLLELDYQTSFDDDAHPRRYDVGFVLDRSPYTYEIYNSATRKLGSADAFGRTLIYFQGKQMVYRPDMTSRRGLTLFGMIGIGPDAHQSADYSINAGAIYQGVFSSRPFDRLGILVADTHYRNNYIDTYYQYRLNVLHGTQRPANDMVISEINYDFLVTHWLDVMPNFQYIANPDGLAVAPFPTRNIPDAFVVGLQFQVNIAKFLGLSKST